MVWKSAELIIFVYESFHIDMTMDKDIVLTPMMKQFMERYCKRRVIGVFVFTNQK
jgi:hypothetical protein